MGRVLTIKIDVGNATAKRTLSDVDKSLCKPVGVGALTEDEVLGAIAKLAESMEQVDFPKK